MRGVFSLESPSDLFQKLEWEFSQLQADIDNPYIAYNFFVTSWHLLEWLHPDPEGTAIRKSILTSEPVLQVCEHLAVGAKHFQPTRKGLNAVQSSKMNIGSWGGAWGTSWGQSWGRGLEVELRGPVVAAFGPRVSVQRLAALTIEFWRTKIRTSSETTD